VTPAPIPFTRVSLMGQELEYVRQAAASGHLTGDGVFTKRIQKWLVDRLGVASALMTSSCTHALEMSALLLDIEPGDEVIIPSFTFVSTVNAFVLRGAKPVFIDCREDTLNMDERQLEKLITKKTRAIVPVHYAGVACEMDTIMEVARTHGIAVVEDNAHALLGKYRGQWLGTFGAMATQSFHDTKNFACGEGGALLVNDASYSERAEIIREKGTNRSRFFRGQVDKYTWVDIGSSYLASELSAAFLLGQFECEKAIQAGRRRIYERYQRELPAWASKRDVRLPVVPEGCEHSWHIYHVMLPTLERRTSLIKHLKQREITAVFHYLPLHLSEYALKLNPTPPKLPVTEKSSDTLLRLPLYSNMTDTEQTRVIDALNDWR